MSGERYLDKAVTCVAAYLTSNIAASLRAVETELSLASGALPDPLDVVTARVEWDERSPLLEVYDTDSKPIHELERLYAVKVDVCFSYLGDADLEAGELLRRRWLTALLDCIQDDRTLGGTVATVVPGGIESDVARGPQATTRHVSILSLEVRVHDA